MRKTVINKCFMFAAFSWLLIHATASGAQTSLASVSTMLNWAGYVVSGASYSGISASWVVPACDCSTPSEINSVSYAWVGLGGYNGETLSGKNALEQIGTAQGCNGSTPAYVVYHEFYPATGQYELSGYPLTAGDTVTASVVRNLDGSYTLSETATAQGANSPKWTFSTTGASTDASNSDPGNSSAEIIMEQPVFSSPLPMAVYGSITFFNIASMKASTASDEVTPVKFSNPTNGKTLANSTSVPSMISPTSFIVYQY
ncbi:G1 family glutamic endopeptidase [Caballeronia sp. LZ035]|uniref:G1 family glutamic endopeptidase n=1 Tax=Caballeronia sp. LZ035 TaxID=3038568 RepID=UPI0028657536|nr:G1 family glutamic endopeptidase [Caballeronia sp. LZ035]MDR5762890.1 G1 family endopeptidase [Caballeronia sp. LZ035]